MKSKGKTQIMMVFTTLFWAGAFIAGKYSANEIPAISLTFFRMFLSFIGICIIRLMSGESDFKVKREDWLPIFGMALTGMVGYHVLFFLALKYTTAVNTSIIAATNPILTMIIGVIIFKDKIKVKNMIALIVSFLGIVIIFTNGDLSKINMKYFGDLIMFVAIGLWVIYSYISKKMLDKYSPLKLTSLVFGLATIILFPFSLFELRTAYNPMIVTNLAWMSVLYMAIFPSIIGYLFQQIAIKDIGPTKTAQFANLVPVFSIIMAHFFLGEQISIMQILAFTLVIAGILINNWKI